MSDAENKPKPQPPIRVGDVPAEILTAVNGMRGRVQALTVELGRLELQKSQYIAEIRRLESSANGMLRSEAERLGIPEGTPWQLTPEGHAMVSAESAAALKETPQGG